MRALNIALGVLASTSFFLVTCTAGGIGATAALKKWGGRDHLAGDPVHPAMPVLAYGPTCPEPYKVLNLDGIPGELPTNRTLRLPVGETSISLDEFRRYDFVATDLDGGRQLVEFDFRADDDHGAIARYIVEGDRIKPIYTYMIGPGTYISAVGYGMSFGIVVLLSARTLRFLLKRQAQRAGLEQPVPERGG